MLGRRVIINILWSGFGQFGSQAIHFGVLLALAWRLSPTDFGLLGMAMIFILFSQAIGELGLAAAIVQRQDVEEPYLSTAFWINLLISFLMSAVTLFFARPISIFLGDEAVTPILRVLSTIYPITALAVVPRALLEQNLNFRKLTYRELWSEIVFGIVGLTTAVLGWGVWSLVAAALAQRVASVATLWWAVEWRPRLLFNWSALRSMMSFGFYVMGAALLNKGLANIDYFVIGRWLGPESLGYYTLAFQLAVVPLQRLIGVLRRVIFPAFSLVQGDKQRLRAGFAQATTYLFLILAPLCILIATLAPWFIKAFYAEKWQPSIIPIQILAIAGLFYGFDIVEPLYFAVGKPQLRIEIIGFRLILFSVLVALGGLAMGIVGIALSLTISAAISGLFGFRLGLRVINAPILTSLRPIILSIGAAAIASLPILLFNFRTTADATRPLLLVLIGATIVFSVLYLCITILFFPEIFRQFKHQLHFGQRVKAVTVQESLHKG